MKRAFLTAVLLCLVGFSGPSASDRSEPEMFYPNPEPRSRPAIDADGNLRFTSTTPPPGLINPAVVMDADTGVLTVTSVTPPPGLVNPAVVMDADTGVLTVTNVTPPPGLVNPAVVMDADTGVLTVTSVTPPPGLANPVVRFTDGGDWRLTFKPPALSVTGALVLMALMLVLGGYALARYRRVQVP